jgi:hypothetical protein
MDVAPPWYELTHQGCSGETRGCSGGDMACRDQAAKDGYVAVSLYSFCRRDEVRTEPRAGGLLLMALLVIAAGGGAVAWRRRQRA